MSAITTSIIIGVTAASAGAQVYAAKKGSDAAKEAAKQQSSAADKALAAQKESYATQRQDFSPYQQAGQAALGRLQQQASAPRQTFMPGQPASLGNPMGSQSSSAPGSVGAFGMAQNTAQAGAGGAMPPGGMPPPGMGQPGPVGTARPPTGQMVMMLGPDGSRRPVPANLVQQFVAKGAKVVQ